MEEEDRVEGYSKEDQNKEDFKLKKGLLCAGMRVVCKNKAPNKVMAGGEREGEVGNLDNQSK